MIKKTTLLLMMLFTAFTFAQATIFPKGSTWNYYDNENQPSNQGGLDWNDITFNDTGSGWTANGTAQLGYGDDGETTDINPNTETAYFRRTITATATEVAYGSLDLDLTYDDGAVVYLNGVEVWSVNMPVGRDYSTLASSTVGDNAIATTNIPNTLVLGTNVIAVEVHQINTSSSDLSFDLSLKGVATQNYIVADDSWKYLDDGSNQNTAWTGIGFNDASWTTNNAKLGYGNDGENTTISFGGDPDNKHITTYFRKTFMVANHTLFGDLSLEAVRDDGMVVYLNGTEVWRDGMSAGTINYDTYATHTSSGTDETDWLTNTIANTLVTGNNVIAVEIHQVNATSSDLGFNFKLTANGIVPAEVVRGPYLQSGTSTSVVIKWRTNTSTESIVNYGTSLALGTTQSDLTLKLNHEITLSGLTPNTKYFFNIANSEGVYLPAESEMHVTTSPTSGTKQFVRAWILGDPGTSGNGSFGNDQENVRDAYYNYVDGSGPTGSPTNPDQTDMILFLGDNAYNNGTDNEYQLGLFDIYDDILKKSVAWSCLGNHDGYSVNFNAQSGPYYDIFTFPTAGEAGGTASGTEEYYSFDYANIHFIVLQSENVDGGGTEVTFNASQKAWLTSDINATSQDWIVAFFHHPPYTKGSHDSDNDGENGIKTMREQYIPILEAGGVDLILSGHSHSYERSKFVKGHTGYSGTFDPNPTTSGGHTVGTNGNNSGRADTADLAYSKSNTDTDGAVYITAGSSGKATGAQFNNQDPYTGANTLPVMYYSAQSLGSTILEVEDDGNGGQNLNIKFLRETGAIDDYFTINKTGITLSTDPNEAVQKNLKIFPVPANDLLNINLNLNERLQSVKFYNTIGELVSEGNKETINVRNMKTGMYLVEIATDKNTYYKSIIIE